MNIVYDNMRMYIVIIYEKNIVYEKHQGEFISNQTY